MMSTTNHGLRRTFAPLLSLVTTLGFSACGASYVPGEQEEVATPQEDVPADVVLAADEFCARLGNARYENWFWDKEDSVWEVAVIGLERRAELDI